MYEKIITEMKNTGFTWKTLQGEGKNHGKKHSLIFLEGKDKKKGWENLANKLDELGISDKQEEK